ncbi:hypothetical protein F4776DRAFT_618277 [Hypoxylon sp. NC0597]|nr:hypothetical protein F4776DRAFT_618277 [Hypoxylon sp. NC0597]
MEARTLLISTIALVSPALAQKEAIVIAEGPKGNSTLDIPVDKNHQNPDVLNVVSSMYLVGSTGIGLNTINCIPYVGSVG